MNGVAEGETYRKAYEDKGGVEGREVRRVRSESLDKGAEGYD
jgi:hypothetical protein